MLCWNFVYDLAVRDDNASLVGWVGLPIPVSHYRARDTVGSVPVYKVNALIADAAGIEHIA